MCGWVSVVRPGDRRRKHKSIRVTRTLQCCSGPCQYIYIWSRLFTKSAHELPTKVWIMRYSTVHEILHVRMPLIDSESEPIWEVNVTKDIDLSNRRDPMHITWPFTNAARSVNESNVGIMWSEVILFIATHARTPWILLTRQQLSNHNGPKGIWNRPHEILFRVTLALDSGQTLKEQCASLYNTSSLLGNEGEYIPNHLETCLLR